MLINFPTNPLTNTLHRRLQSSTAQEQRFNYHSHKISQNIRIHSQRSEIGINRTAVHDAVHDWFWSVVARYAKIEVKSDFLLHIICSSVAAMENMCYHNAHSAFKRTKGVICVKHSYICLCVWSMEKLIAIEKVTAHFIAWNTLFRGSMVSPLPCKQNKNEQAIYESMEKQRPQIRHLMRQSMHIAWVLWMFPLLLLLFS